MGYPGVVQRRADLAGAAKLELVSGVVQLRPEPSSVRHQAMHSDSSDIR